MDTIIRFFMDNFYLVFIIIAILSALSRGSGKQKRDTRNPNESMPPFGGGPERPGRTGQPKTAEPQWQEQDPVERQGESRRLPEVIQSEWQREAEEKARRAAAVPDTRPQLAQREIGSVDMIQELLDRDSPILTQQDAADKKRVKDIQRKAVEGLIWAEILGPPRSKKLYRK